MDRSLSSTSTLLFLVLSATVASGAVTLLPEDYWRQVLPNTPIPGAIRTLLYPDLLREVRDAPFKNGVRPTKWNYRSAANENQARNDPVGAFFFLEKDLHPNTRKQLQFIRSAPPAPFIPRPVAGAIPFSSKKLPELMARFSLRPNSVGAEDMTASLHECEHSGVAGETKSCVTSLESMVDFATSNLGTRDVRASSTEVGGEDLEQKQQYYTVAAGVETLQEGGKAVVCHVQAFPYAVFSCHATDSVTKAYKVPLVGEDGSKVTAVAVCHIDTSAWNPRNLAFQVLKVKPGSIPVCHFLLQDAVVWTPSM